MRYITDIAKINDLSVSEHAALKKVTEVYRFRANEYYLNLINWNLPRDPIRRTIIPNVGELEGWGTLDPSDEKTNYVCQGLQHKYRDTVLFLIANECESLCRYCFRKRIFNAGRNEAAIDYSHGLRYIESHPEIKNVILSGGEPLLLPTRQLRNILNRLSEINHLQSIRIGTKMPAFNPYRILNDSDFLKLIRSYSDSRHRLYFITHFNHSRELTVQAIEALGLLIEAGAILCNQTPIVRGINDSTEDLRKLLNLLTAVGNVPYYIFINRPTSGNKHFAVPLVKAFNIFSRAKAGMTGIAKRARMVLSHSSGKSEIVGISDDKIYLRYHQARALEDESRIIEYQRNDEAYWIDELDEYDELVGGSEDIYLSPEKLN